MPRKTKRISQATTDWLMKRDHEIKIASLSLRGTKQPAMTGSRQKNVS
ncbi:MAG: hypothetical protein FWH23_07105 [Bacteroidales bacterium]|nr:hypothetical protein [Bacteroidales bacterium]